MMSRWNSRLGDEMAAVSDGKKTVGALSLVATADYHFIILVCEFTSYL